MSLGIYFICRDMRFSPVKVSGSVRTGCHTISAAYAPVIINNYNSIRLLPGGFYRTNLSTLGIPALLTLYRNIKISFFSNKIRIIMNIRMCEVNAFFLFHLQNLDIMNLRIPGLIIFFYTGIYASSAVSYTHLTL